MALDKSNQKIIIWSAVGFISFIILTVIVWYIMKIRAANKETREAAKEINQKNVTLSQGDINGLVNSMWAAIADSYQEDEESIIHIISLMKTADDWKAFKLAFNQKYATTSSWGNQGDLSYWITKKTPELIPEINEMLQKLGESV